MFVSITVGFVLAALITLVILWYEAPKRLKACTASEARRFMVICVAWVFIPSYIVAMTTTFLVQVIL